MLGRLPATRGIALFEASHAPYNVHMHGKWLRRPRKKRPKGPFKTEEQIARALAERAANRETAARGLPLPHPNLWDAIDPTKVSRSATPQEILASYREFCRICPPHRPRRHTL